MKQRRTGFVRSESFSIVWLAIMIACVPAWAQQPAGAGPDSVDQSLAAAVQELRVQVQELRSTVAEMKSEATQ